MAEKPELTKLYASVKLLGCSRGFKKKIFKAAMMVWLFQAER